MLQPLLTLLNLLFCRANLGPFVPAAASIFVRATHGQVCRTCPSVCLHDLARIPPHPSHWWVRIARQRTIPRPSAAVDNSSVDDVVRNRSIGVHPGCR
jgi:hypothetical protein